jgi:hypothetical protein
MSCFSRYWQLVNAGTSTNDRVDLQPTMLSSRRVASYRSRLHRRRWHRRHTITYKGNDWVWPVVKMDKAKGMHAAATQLPVRCFRVRACPGLLPVLLAVSTCKPRTPTRLFTFFTDLMPAESEVSGGHRRRNSWLPVSPPLPCDPASTVSILKEVDDVFIIQTTGVLHSCREQKVCSVVAYRRRTSSGGLPVTSPVVQARTWLVWSCARLTLWLITASACHQSRILAHRQSCSQGYRLLKTRLMSEHLMLVASASTPLVVTLSSRGSITWVQPPECPGIGVSPITQRPPLLVLAWNAALQHRPSSSWSRGERCHGANRCPLSLKWWPSFVLEMQKPLGRRITRESG